METEISLQFVQVKTPPLLVARFILQSFPHNLKENTGILIPLSVPAVCSLGLLHIFSEAKDKLEWQNILCVGSPAIGAMLIAGLCLLRTLSDTKSDVRFLLSEYSKKASAWLKHRVIYFQVQLKESSYLSSTSKVDSDVDTILEIFEEKLTYPEDNRTMSIKVKNNGGTVREHPFVQKRLFFLCRWVFFY